ncbi:hypothetical protein AgCh_025230 [Apium graveolens]
MIVESTYYYGSLLYRSGQGHIVDGTSVLIVNESQTSNDEPRSQISAVSTSEQRINDSQEHVILELEEDEFYTQNDLDELDQSIAYLARKFSNIRVKKPRKFKKAKKDKAYLELEAKYEALLKKQQAKPILQKEKAGPLVTFGDNIKGFTMAYGKIDLEMLSLMIKKTGEVALKGARKGSLFIANLDSTNEGGICCFYTKESTEQNKLWHRILSHLNYKAINTLVKKELVRDMPKLEFARIEVCEACRKGKMKRSSHKSKTVNSISAHLQLIHMDLFGPVNVLSISRNKYALVMVDDFSRYTWAEDHNCVNRLRSDNGTEFMNATLSEFYKGKGIVQEFSAARTPQQNGVVERKNRTLVEAARAMLHDANLSNSFWEEAVNNA